MRSVQPVSAGIAHGHAGLAALHHADFALISHPPNLEFFHRLPLQPIHSEHAHSQARFIWEKCPAANFAIRCHHGAALVAAQGFANSLSAWRITQRSWPSA
jgi:hypothetical protein